MKLSACYIVRDSEDVLETSLQSIVNDVDEIVVVDTGSTDRTVEIASKYGASIYEYPWQDDFAAARNFALEKAQGEWILFLDADEYVIAKTTTKLKQIISKYGAGKETLLVKIINIDTEQQDNILDAFFAPRIFKNNARLYYTGKIHEQLLREGKETPDAGIVPEMEMFLYHTGYSSAQMRVKAERNLKLLLEEIKTIEKPEPLYTYLAEVYEALGDEEKALQYATLAIEAGRQNITYASRAYRIWLRLKEQAPQPDDNAIEKVLEKAMLDFPELPEFRAEYAQYLAARFLYDVAIAQMQHALHEKADSSSLEPSMFDANARKTASQLMEKWQKEKELICNLRISACVITKNEGEEIGRWIENMKQCSDEQILVDTGSTDDTVAIAEAAGVKVYHYKWKNDFSAAKNFAIEKAKGDWIVFLDADEFFTPETVGNVRNVIAREHSRVAEVDVILCPIINIDVDKNNIEINRFVNLRLFRNVSYLRYVGNIHESVRHKDNELRIFIEKKYLEIYHTGYSSQRVKEKTKRNLKLLQEDIAKNGEGIQHYRYLMDCYQGVGDHEKTIKYGKLHLESNAYSISNESDVYRTLINSMVFMKKDPEEIRPYIEEALAQFKDIPDFYAYYAANFFRQGNFIMAKKYLLQALEVFQKNQKHSTNSSGFAYIVSEVYSYLGNIAWREGKQEEACRYIDLALKDNRYNSQAFRQLCKAQCCDSIERFSLVAGRYYDNSQRDLIFIVQNLEQIAVDEIYFHYARVLEEHYNVVSQRTKWQRLLADGKPGQVYQETLQQSTEKMKELACMLLCMEKEDFPIKAEEFLPVAFWNCIQRYHKVLPRMNEEDSDGYMAILPAVICLNMEKVLQEFVMISEDFSMQVIRNIIKVLFEYKCWQQADMLIAFYLKQATQKENDVLRMAGIAAYYCGHFIEAEKYLAQLSAESENEDVFAYLQWAKNRKIYKKVQR